MIAGHPTLEYVHEPLNPDGSSRRVYGLEPRHWWLHIGPENEDHYAGPVRRIVDMRPRLWPRLRETESWSRRWELWKEHRRLRKRRRNGGRVLIKDPIALFSAEWLYQRFGADVVVVVRHPAAWVDSFLRTGWPQPRAGIRDQPRLRDDLLRPFRDVLQGDAEAGDRLERTCMTWNMFMHVIRTYRRRHADWIFVRHEDLSREPLNGFQHLYETLGLEFDSTSQDLLRRHAMADEKTASYAMESIVRDSRHNLRRWRENLSADSVERIRDLTAEYWSDFYDAREW